jgi:Fe-S oxidoreductase
VLAKVADLVPAEQECSSALCCGGSLGILNVTQHQRDVMTTEVISILTRSKPDLIATGCPLCKKTLARKSPVEVRDIAELINQAIPG